MAARHLRWPAGIRKRGRGHGSAGAILTRYKVISEAVAKDRFAPLLWSDPDTGAVTAEDWAAGFAQTLALRPKRWQKLMWDEGAVMLLAPILILGDPDTLPGMAGLDPGEIDEIREKALDALPESIAGLADYWSISTPDRREFAKPGRNDPCPCGSGKKFKKCCGGPPAL